MELPIDSSALVCMCSHPGRPRLKFGTTEQERNWKDEPVFETGVMITFEGRSEVLEVRSTEEPPAMAMGQGLRLVGLRLRPWERDGRSGVTYSATRIEVLGRPSAKEAA